jgi:hypothetical protein
MAPDPRPAAGGADLGGVISHLFRSRSPRAARLLEEAGLWSFRRTPEPDWLAGRPGRRLFHWGLGPVTAGFQKAFAAQGLDRYLAERPVELFSFDLGPAARRHQGILPLSRPLGPTALRRHTEAALRFVRRFYRGPLAAENYNFYPTGLYGHITEPAFIRRYLEEFGLGLALDLAHGAVTAHNLGRRPEDYFAELPLERVMEIHVSRPWLPPVPGVWAADAHALPAAREWAWLAGVLRSGRCPKAAPVFIEYYGDLGRLVRAQADLAALIRTYRWCP